MGVALTDPEPLSAPPLFHRILPAINKKAAQARERGEQELEPECRFLFPHHPHETAEMIRHPGKTWWSFEGRRNDTLMNQYNRLIALAWLANTDISPCPGVEVVINYAAKYRSKTKQQTASYAEIAKEILPTSRIRNRCSLSSLK